MFKAIKEFFFGKPQASAAESVTEAPYKVEAPTFKPTADAAPAAEPAVKKSAPPRAKKPAVAKPAAKKPAAPRKPRTPAA
jgi:hypothetical protein